MSLAERYVRSRFDDLEARFRADIRRNDFRLRSISHLYASSAGARLLDLGCGKGRFGSEFARQGFEVVGLDPSEGMLHAARGIDRLKGSAGRLPFASGSFDGILAVEVLEHLEAGVLDAAIGEMARVLKRDGVAAIIDKNVGALDARRPWLPSLARKRIDERRGLWMYPADAPFRERWFRPGSLKAKLCRRFGRVDVEFLLSPAERRNAIHRAIPRSRLYTLWVARKPGGGELD